MKRRTFDLLMSAGGLVLTIVLVVAGSLLLVGWKFADNQVHDRLAAQNIFFPPKGSEALADPQIGPYLNQYAGQQLVTGDQALAWSDHFMLVHLNAVAGGKTYSEVSALSRENPDDQELAGQVETLFRGTTLQGHAAGCLRVLAVREDRVLVRHRRLRARGGDGDPDDPGVRAPAPGHSGGGAVARSGHRATASDRLILTRHPTNPVGARSPGRVRCDLRHRLAGRSGAARSATRPADRQNEARSSETRAVPRGEPRTVALGLTGPPGPAVRGDPGLVRPAPEEGVIRARQAKWNV